MEGAAVATLAAVGLLVSACATAPPGPSAAASPAAGPSSALPALSAVPGMAAEVIRYRTDEAAGGRVQVLLTDTGTAPFTVTSVAVDSPGFAPLPATPLSAGFAPGQTIALPVPHGEVQCSSPPEPAAARVTVVRPDGATEELRVPATGETLGRLHEQECAVAAVGAVVDIALDDLAAAPDGDRLTGVVVLGRRVAGEPVEVRALGSSVLLQPVLEVELPVRLPPDAADLRVPVTFRVASCDAHVVAEAKKPFVFPLSVVVGDRQAVSVDLPVDEGQRDALLRLVEGTCG